MMKWFFEINHNFKYNNSNKNFNALIKEKVYEFEKETCRREKQRFNIPMIRAEEFQ